MAKTPILNQTALNHVLLISYDGSEFKGWQSSIEAILNRALEKIIQEPITLQAASRTDSGVHADGQVINFFSQKTPDLRSLNALLPKSITVLDHWQAPDNFHPSLDVLEKTYTYQICYGPIQLPKYRKYSWHVPYYLDLEKMQRAATYLVGKQDFSAFTNQDYDDTYRIVSSIDLSHDPSSFKFSGRKTGRLSIAVTGNHFLYRMVRIIVGTLVYVGRGRISPDEIPDIVASKSRCRAGITAPAHGLTLSKIVYDRTK